MVSEVVNAATTNKPKKITAKTVPPHIFEKTIGKLWKTSVGPESGATPKLNKDGKIIKPASTAITVFIIPVIVAVLTKFSPLSR